MAEPIVRELTLPAATSSLSQVRKAVLEAVSITPFPDGEKQLLALAVDEAVANVVEHAYPQPATGKNVKLRLIADVEHFEAVVIDSGSAFDPSTIPDVNIREHVRKGSRGGLGIFLIRKIMDEIVHLRSAEDFNELHLVKYVDSKGPKARSNKVKSTEGVRKRWR